MRLNGYNNARTSLIELRKTGFRNYVTPTEGQNLK